MTETMDQSSQAHLSKRVALVTGAGRGLGRSIATQLARAGASVVLVSRSEDQLKDTVDAIVHAGGTAAAVPADLSLRQDVLRVTIQAKPIFGPIEILVNNAATVAPLGPTVDLDSDGLGDSFALNVFAPMLLTARVLPSMLAAGWGRIINISSGIVARPEFMTGGNVYAATKSALEGHTLNLAAEVSGTGVTVNAYRPGSVDTSMQTFIRSQDPNRVGGGLVERFQKSHESGSLISADQSARFLLSLLDSPDTGTIWSFSNNHRAPPGELV